MKIALLCDDTLDSTDGVQQYVLTLGRWLSSNNHEVHYLTSTSIRKDLPNLHILSKRIATKFNSNHGGMPLPASKKQIKQLLEREQFDIVHIQMPYSPLLAGKVINLAPKSTKIIGTFHIFPQSKLVAVATKILGMWVRRQLPKFSQIVSVSSAAQKFAKQSFGINTEVVPNMVDLDKFPSADFRDKSKKLKIVFLGRLVERKGSIYLLKALAELKSIQLSTEYEVVVAGKGPLLPTLKQYAEQNSLFDTVSFPGFIAEENKSTLLSSADIAVFPSTGGESFGISLIEAMAATPGPVIAGDNPGYRTVMEGADNQVINPKDIQNFAKILAHYIEDNSARKSAHLWQLDHVKQYDTNFVATQVIDVYKRALQHGDK